MSKRKASLAVNLISNYLDELHSKKPEIFNKTLKQLGVNKIVSDKCYSVGIFKLKDLYASLETIKESYNYDGDRLWTLKKHIQKIYEKQLKIKSVKSIKVKKITTPPHKKALHHSRLISIIESRSSDECCLCATFRELVKLTEKEFIDLMRFQYKKICKFKLDKGRVNSWRDEYREIIKHFIPIFRHHDKNILDFHIIFELKLPLVRTDLSVEQYVYCDAVIVGDDGFVVLEFKQRDADVVDHYWKEALKYIKRLRFHNIGRKQHFRYTYLVCTAEPEINVWCYDNKEDFWFGNSQSVAKDMCTQFFDLTVPNTDIHGWLTAGFREKR